MLETIIILVALAYILQGGCMWSLGGDSGDVRPVDLVVCLVLVLVFLWLSGGDAPPLGR